MHQQFQEKEDTLYPTHTHIYIYIYVDVIKTVFLFLIIKKNVKKFKIRVLATYMIAEYLTKKNSLVVIIKNGIYLLTMHNIILKICTT